MLIPGTLHRHRFTNALPYPRDELIKRVWNEIHSSQYVAQSLIGPSERGVLIDNAVHVALKMDIRTYVYERAQI